MNKSKILVGLIAIVYVLFIVFQFGGHSSMALNFRSLILPSIAITYFISVRRKSIFFSLFLLFYAASDIMYLVSKYFNIPYSVDYFLGNSLYILAYGTLLFKVCKSINLIEILKNYKIHLVVLTLLNIYIVYVLQAIIDPDLSMNNEYYLELTYNLVMLFLLSASLLNYFYRDDRKSLLLFLGSICIVFSEVMGVAYLYVAQEGLLNFISTTLSLLAFYFIFKQSRLENTIKQEMNMVTDNSFNI